MFFDAPLPDNLITVPSCNGCNAGVKNDEEYLRAFLMALRGHVPGEAIESVRGRVKRQFDYQPRLRQRFLDASELWPEIAPNGGIELELHTSPDSLRLRSVLSNYARALHFWSTRALAPPDALLSIERVFHRQTRPLEYWAPILAALDFASAGTVSSRGATGEFRLSFRALRQADLLSAMVIEFYRSFAYVVLICRPGTNPEAIRLPF
jgi:hypothetical protein